MLTAKKVERTKMSGRYPCGLVKGLLLQVTESGAKSWVLRYQLHGDERWLGLGSAGDFTLKEARERARAARQLLADGIDPLEKKRADRAAAKHTAAHKKLFRDAAQNYFDQNEKGWRSASHRDEFLRSLEAYAYPVIGGMDVAAIGVADVLRILEPIWTTKTITAARVRNRIEHVLDWCVVREYRPSGPNPAAWKANLDQVLPKVRKVAPVAHHAAMDYRQVPQFIAKLRQSGGIASKALQFLILTAARAGEVVNATWTEIDLDDKTWILPGHRMKGHREHRVPLTPAALDLLHQLPRDAGNPHVFIGGRAGAALSKMAMNDLVNRLGYHRVITVHGFRSSFSNWSHEQTAHASHTIEISLAHHVGTETERAYRRTDMLAKRRQLMEQWSKFCMSPSAKAGGDVIALRGAR
jgi:integrase